MKRMEETRPINKLQPFQRLAAMYDYTNVAKSLRFDNRILQYTYNVRKEAPKAPTQTCPSRASNFSSMKATIPSTTTTTAHHTQDGYDMDKALDRLKKRLKLLVRNPYYGPSVMLPEATLMKWLKDTGLNVVYAEAKIRRAFKLRQKNKLNDFTGYKPHPLLKLSYPGGVCGVDREGCPIYYELLGILNMKDILNSVPKDELIKYKIFEILSIFSNVDKSTVWSPRASINPLTGQLADTLLIIVDLQQCQKDILWGPVMRIWAEIIEVLQELFASLVKEIIVLNHNFLLPEIYLALRPYMSRQTLSLITVLGHNFLPHLFQRIEKHEIPAYLGGYKCDPFGNPYCPDYLHWQGKIPQWQHFGNVRHAAHTTHKTILAGEKVTDEYHIPLADSLLCWEFYTISRPILFYVTVNHAKGSNTAYAPVLLSMDSTQRTSVLTCHSAGRYLVVLDNCKNHTHPTKVHYKITVEPPGFLLPKIGPRTPLGDSFDYLLPMGEEEKKLHQEIKARQVTHKWPDEKEEPGETQ